MSLHFMAVLGTSLYEPVCYRFGDEDLSKKQERQFVQTAVIEHYKEELKEDGKITVFVTQKSKEMNLNDREYLERDKKASERWTSKKKNDVNIGGEKPGLLKEIRKLDEELRNKVNVEQIPDGGNESEIWEQFGKIFEAVNKGDEIVFDITHAFRSIPLLALAVVNYAKVIKGCKVKSICYGAFEANEIVEINGTDVKITQVIDLTTFNDILAWSNAADGFIRYGNADQIKEMFDLKYNNVSGQEKRNWSSLKKIVGKADVLSNTLRTSRGADGNRLSSKGNKKSQSSIKSAYKEFADAIKDGDTKYIDEVEPLYKLLETVSSSFEMLDKEKNYEVGLSVVKWCIDNGMIQQGYTALEETMITYLCDKHNLDDMCYHDREVIVNQSINIAKNYYKDHNEKTGLGKKEYIYNEYVTTKKMEKKDMEHFVCIVEGISEELAGVFDKIKECRNDINHFGMREKPLQYTKLEDNLIEAYDAFRENM